MSVLAGGSGPSALLRQHLVVSILDVTSHVGGHIASWPPSGSILGVVAIDAVASSSGSVGWRPPSGGPCLGSDKLVSTHNSPQGAAVTCSHLGLFARVSRPRPWYSAQREGAGHGKTILHAVLRSWAPHTGQVEDSNARLPPWEGWTGLIDQPSILVRRTTSHPAAQTVPGSGDRLWSTFLEQPGVSVALSLIYISSPDGM